MVNDNRVLKLDISDLKHSNDSLIQSLEDNRKSLKIKENALKQAISVQTIIRDTVIQELPVEYHVTTGCDFTVELVATDRMTGKQNPLTTCTISRFDNKIEWVPCIKNGQDLIIYNNKEWRNPNKNFFKRLFTWDWKKDNIDRYSILNSNPSIEITDTRIINMNK